MDNEVYDIVEDLWDVWDPGEQTEVSDQRLKPWKNDEQSLCFHPFRKLKIIEIIKKMREIAFGLGKNWREFSYLGSLWVG